MDNGKKTTSSSKRAAYGAAPINKDLSAGKKHGAEDVEESVQPYNPTYNTVQEWDVSPAKGKYSYALKLQQDSSNPTFRPTFSLVRKPIDGEGREFATNIPLNVLVAILRHNEELQAVILQSL